MEKQNNTLFKILYKERVNSLDRVVSRISPFSIKASMLVLMYDRILKSYSQIIGSSFEEEDKTSEIADSIANLGYVGIKVPYLGLKWGKHVCSFTKANSLLGKNYIRAEIECYRFLIIMLRGYDLVSTAYEDALREIFLNEDNRIKFSRLLEQRKVAAERYVRAIYNNAKRIIKNVAFDLMNSIMIEEPFQTEKIIIQNYTI